MESTSKYKVGDRVRIVAERCGHEFCIGETVTIKWVGTNDYEAVSKFGDAWFIEDDEVEPFVEPQLTPEQYVAAIQETVPELGVKFDADKPKWSLMPRGVLSQVVSVMTFGAKKYSPDNWMHVDPARYYDALHRHIDAWRDGQRLDPETGKHHLAHALCCLIFMLWHDDNKKESDVPE